MNTSPRYRNLLRTLFSSIMVSKLSPSEIRRLAEELRRGRLAEELAYMLDQSTSHFVGERESGLDKESVASIERLVKQRKISRLALANILRSLGWSSVPGDSSIRSMLQSFIDESPTSKVDKLHDVLDSMGANDEFLAGISNTRK